MEKELKIRVRVDAKTGELSVIGGAFQNLEGKVNRSNEAMKTIKRTLAGLGVGFSLKKIIDEFREYETLTANIAKTTGMGFGSEELNSLTGELDKLATTMSGMRMQDLYEIAEGAGQLGIHGEADILKFTKSIKMLQLTTDLSASEASTGFARIANALDEPIDNIDHLASAFNELSNNSTANVRDLMMFTQRLAPVARGFGLSTAEVVGLSGAMKDLGINFEVGGTSMNKLMGSMQAKTALFAQQIGIPFAEFDAMMKNKPMAALDLFSQKLNSLESSDKYAFLDNLGFSGTETSTVLLNVANNLDKVRTNIEIANEGYISGTSHIEEYNQASQTTDNKIIQMESSFDNLQKTIGSTFKEVLAGSTENIIEFLNGSTTYVNEHKDIWIEKFKMIWEYISSGLTTVGEMMATFFNFVGNNIDTVENLAWAFAFMKGASWLSSGIGIATGLMYAFGNSTALAGNKATRAAGKYANLLNLIAKIPKGPMLGASAALGIGAYAIDANLKRANKNQFRTYGKDIKELTADIKELSKMKGIDGDKWSDDAIDARMGQMGRRISDLYVDSTQKKIVVTKTFKTATDDATNSITKLGKAHLGFSPASSSKPKNTYKDISFDVSGELFDAPKDIARAKKKEQRETKAAQKKEQREAKAAQRKADREERLAKRGSSRAKSSARITEKTAKRSEDIAKREAEKKSRYLQNFNDYHDRTTMEQTAFQKQELDKRLAEHAANGMDMLKIDKIRAVEMAKINEKISLNEERKTKKDWDSGVWGSGKAKEMTKSSEAVAGDMFSKEKSSDYAREASKTFSGEFQKSLFGDDSKKGYQNLGASFGKTAGGFISSAVSDFANGSLDDMGASLKGFAEQGISAMKNSGDPTMAAIGYGIDISRGVFREMMSETIDLETNLGADDTGIVDSLSQLSDVMYPQLEYTKQMTKHLQSMENSFSQIAVGLSHSTSMDYTGAEFVPEVGGLGGDDGSFLAALGNSLYGKTTELRNAGLSFGEQTVEEFIKGVDVQGYQNVRTNKSYAFGLFESTKDALKYTEVDGKTKDAFAQAIGDGYETIMIAGTSLGFDSDKMAETMSKQSFKLGGKDGKLDFRDKSEAEIQAILSGTIGTQLSNMIDATDIEIQAFTKAGESQLSTLVRTASGYEQGTEALNRLGIGVVSFSDITNKQGVVAVETIRDSIQNSLGRSSGIAGILDVFDGSASEIVEAYKALDKYQYILRLTSRTQTDVTQNMIDGAGDDATLFAGQSSYLEGFFTAQERSDIAMKELNREFENFNISLPETNEGFRALAEGLDLSTKAGQKQYGFLMKEASAFDAVKKAEKELHDLRLSQAEEARDLIFSTAGLGNSFKLEYASSLYEKAMQDNNREGIKKYSQKTTELMMSQQYGVEAQNRLLAITKDTQRALGNEDKKVQEVTDKEAQKAILELKKATDINTRELGRLRKDMQMQQPVGRAKTG